MDTPNFNSLIDMHRWADLAMQAANGCDLSEALEFTMNAAIVSEKVRDQHPHEAAALSVSFPSKLATVLKQRCSIPELGVPKFTRS